MGIDLIYKKLKLRSLNDFSSVTPSIETPCKLSFLPIK